MAGRKYPPAINRMVARTYYSDDGCWLLLPKKGNYAWIGVNGKATLAHRASWEIHNGPIPEDRWVLHKCIGHGNCWNPEHLYLGTPKQNSADRDRQGRHVPHLGETNGRAKLTPDLVRELRGPTGGFTCEQIGEMYGISKQQVSDIRNRKNWKHI